MSSNAAHTENEEMRPVFDGANNEPTAEPTHPTPAAQTASVPITNDATCLSSGEEDGKPKKNRHTTDGLPNADADDGAKSDGAESVESDYYYDDDGKMHTYYRPKRQLSTHSQRKKASRAGTNVNTPKDNNAPDNASVGSHGTATGSMGSTLKGSLAELPKDLRGIGKQINKLSTEELLYISAMVGRKAHRDAYSVLQYSGGAWYLPNIRKVHKDEKEWELGYQMGSGLIITLAGKRMEIQVLGYLIRAAVLVALWYAFYNALPQYLSKRGGYIFDPVVTLLVCSVVGGFICRILQIPPLVGVLWFGILWNNIGPEVGYLTSGIYKDVRTISGRFGITVVLLRAGFSISWKTVKPILPNVAGLVIGAFGVESTVHGFFANYLFEFNNYKYAFLEGCLCSAPSAAVVVPGSLMLQSEGYSKTKGPLPVMLASVALETVVSVWVVSFILDLEFGSRSVGLSSALGPIQLIVGALLGIILGLIFHGIVVGLLHEANRLPTGKYAQTHLASVHRGALATFLIMAHCVIFFAYYQNLAGGGAVTVMMFACTVSNLWTWNYDAKNPSDVEWMDMKKELGAGLCDVWDLFVMPFLFSMTGSKIVASKIFNSTFFPKALAIWVTSNAARMVAIFFAPTGLNFTWKERFFMVPGYCAKATVQSSLASAALDFVNKKIAATTDPDELAALAVKKGMAETVGNMAIFYVMWSAPLAAAWVTKLGPRMLIKED